VNLNNWFSFLIKHWIIALLGIVFLMFIIEIIQLLISRFKSKLSQEQKEQLKEISRLRKEIKFGKSPRL
jgi:hypothetical protein